MKKITILLLFIITSQDLFSQNVGINTTTPNSNALLDVPSSDKGALMSRTALSATNLSAPLSAHVEGMLVYNTTNNLSNVPVSVQPSLYYNDGAKWVLMGPTGRKIGDIKQMAANKADHEGWVLLDGRLISSLTSIQQINAVGLGFSTNIPNVTDTYIKATNGAGTGNIHSGNTFTLTQGQLPNVNFTGTTSTNGAHSHTYSDTNTPTETLGLATNVLALLPLLNIVVAKPDNLAAFSGNSVNEGSHTHSLSIPSGGSDATISQKPQYLSVNIYIFLGQ
ncbi:hypothetical protein [Flavobacterium terrigena]|uniref:Microcystin-dependent protein n=1 Tax=Flavobacterium terrigena TaxID=402734 RepID=A0A1H6QQG8_9FLAO|nr:hypothetical protein [Flavobacterium terrigena]SEI43204.1 Microcystin-dependent protein [Flavobacterium terrigena]